MDAPQRRGVAVLGAASSIGIRPYDGRRQARALHEAPRVLREAGLVSRLAAEDLGDVTSPPYRDYRRRPGTVRNETDVALYSRALAARVAEAPAGRRLLVLGGDCSIILGCLLGLRRRAARLGLAYIDAHADFATPQESLTGSAASMCLALSTGRGDSPLAALDGGDPLVHPRDVALVGRRDEGQSSYGHSALAHSGILDLPGDRATRDRGGTTAAILDRVARPELDGFWIHLDADVLRPGDMPAVDSPEPGGPRIDELAALVGPLARHPKALGLQVTIYDPGLDPDRSSARRLVELIERVLMDIPSGGDQ